MTYADVVSELVYHLHKDLAEIAGLDNRQLRGLYFRARDKHGRLKKGRIQAKRKWDFKSKPGRRNWETMFKDAKRFQSARFVGKMINGKKFEGFTEGEIEVMWQQYLNDNPTLKGHIDYATETGQGRRT